MLQNDANKIWHAFDFHFVFDDARRPVHSTLQIYYSTEIFSNNNNT